MKHPEREEFERVKKLARDAIEASKERARLRKPPSPESLARAIEDKRARGEAPTDEEIAALAAAVSQNQIKRGRGRPKGSADSAARRAFFAALIATDHCNLPMYRNAATGHRMTLCDALAEAMRESGLTSFTTYDAAAAKLRSYRKGVRDAAAILKRHLMSLKEAIKPLEQSMKRLRAAMTIIIARTGIENESEKTKK